MKPNHEQYQNITRMRAEGKTLAVIGSELGISRQRIHQIIGNSGRIIKVKVKPQQPTIEQRFWEKVDKSGECWLWTGAKTAEGYGAFSVNKKRVYAHRFSYTQHHGEIPAGSMVLHKCNNPGCVNPSHLYAGSAKDNAVDRSAAGNSVPYKLNRKLAKRIRSQRPTHTISQLANMYNVSACTIVNVIGNRIYK